MTGKHYKDYGERAEHLWRVCGRLRETAELVGIDAPTFLAFPDRRGGERMLICGPNAIQIDYACNTGGVACKTWIRLASIVTSFATTDVERVRAAKKTLLGEEPGTAYAIACSRSSVAAALRGYRRRRDAMLAAEKAMGESSR